jgi:hypothetical protein
MIPNTYKPVGAHVEVGDLDPAVAVTVPSRANAIMMQAIGDEVIVRLDGTAADIDTGFQLGIAAAPTILPVRAGSVLSFFEASAGSILQYQFLRSDNRSR